MPKASHISYWIDYKERIDKKILAFIESFGDTLPKIFYEIKANGEVIAKPILEVVYYSKETHLYYTGKKPTTADIEKIISIERDLILNKDGLRFKYDEHNWRSEKDVNESPWMTFSKEEAEIKSKELVEKIIREKDLLENGHIRCQRCHKVFPENEVVNSVIIGRSSRPVWDNWKNRMVNKSYVTQEPMKFCSGECASHEQMSREG